MQETVASWLEDAKKNAGWIIVLGVVTVIAGFLALVMPWAGGLGTAVFVGFLLIVGGIARVLAAFSAVMSVILGFLLLKEWPLTGLWAIGTLVGINMLFAGFALISFGSAARKLVKQTV